MKIPNNIVKFIKKNFDIDVSNMTYVITPLVKAKGTYNLQTKQISISKYICPKDILGRAGESVVVHELIHYIQANKLGLEEMTRVYSTEKGRAFIESQAERYAFWYDSKFYIDNNPSIYRPILNRR